MIAVFNHSDPTIEKGVTIAAKNDTEHTVYQIARRESVHFHANDSHRVQLAARIKFDGAFAPADLKSTHGRV
jgi:hypothetical protein